MDIIPADVIRLIVANLLFDDTLALSRVSKRMYQIVSVTLSAVKVMCSGSSSLTRSQAIDMLERAIGSVCSPLIYAIFVRLFDDGGPHVHHINQFLLSTPDPHRERIISRLRDYRHFFSALVCSNNTCMIFKNQPYTPCKGRGLVEWQHILMYLSEINDVDSIAFVLSVVVKLRKESHLISNRQLNALVSLHGSRIVDAMGWHRGYMLYCYLTLCLDRLIIIDKRIVLQAMELHGTTFDQQCILIHAKHLFKNGKPHELKQFLSDFPLEEAYQAKLTRYTVHKHADRINSTRTLHFTS